MAVVVVKLNHVFSPLMTVASDSVELNCETVSQTPGVRKTVDGCPDSSDNDDIRTYNYIQITQNVWRKNERTTVVSPPFFRGLFNMHRLTTMRDVKSERGGTLRRLPPFKSWTAIYVKTGI